MLRADRAAPGRVTARIGRVGRAILAVWLCAATAGCGALRAEKFIAPAAARDAVQSALGEVLVETPLVSSVAALNDVTATYALRTTNERLLVVVFKTREASVQLTGPDAAHDGGLVVNANVVALYEHDRGTISRLPALRSAMRGLRATAR